MRQRQTRQGHELTPGVGAGIARTRCRDGGTIRLSTAQARSVVRCASRQQGVCFSVIVFPIISAVLSAMCAIVVASDARRKPRPDKIIWTLAFLMFALAAGADAVGRAIEWTPWLARLYYATGPALVVAYLAIGQVYLLTPRAMARFGVGATMLVTALWVPMVWSAPIDPARLAVDGWDAIERGPEMVAITIAINAIGTAIIVGGTAYSVWRFSRTGVMRHRMIGCALICAGTLVVAAGGSLTRLGHYEYLYIAMSVGVGLIFLGVLSSRRPESSRLAVSADMGIGEAGTDAAFAAPAWVSRGGERELTGVGGGPAPTRNANEAISYIETVLLPLCDAELERVCAEWSVPRDVSVALSRHDARRAWRLRGMLKADAARMFDAHTVGARRQLTVLYHEVLAWDRANPDDITELVTSSDVPARSRQAQGM